MNNKPTATWREAVVALAAVAVLAFIWGGGQVAGGRTHAAEGCAANEAYAVVDSQTAGAHEDTHGAMRMCVNVEELGK